jgi:hypothetical protein
MRQTLIQHMHDLSQTLASANPLPAPFDHRGFFTAAQMAQIIGRPPRWTDGTALHLLGWTRTVRKIKGITKRVWLPPRTNPEVRSIPPLTTLNPQTP